MATIGWLRQGSSSKAKAEPGDSQNKRGRTTRGPIRARAILSTSDRKDFDLSHESETVKSILGLLLKGQANMHQRMKVMECAVSDCFHVPTICPLVIQGNEAYEGYSQYVKENPKADKGPPGL